MKRLLRYYCAALLFWVRMSKVAMYDSRFRSKSAKSLCQVDSFMLIRLTLTLPRPTEVMKLRCLSGPLREQDRGTDGRWVMWKHESDPAIAKRDKADFERIVELKYSDDRTAIDFSLPKAKSSTRM